MWDTTQQASCTLRRDPGRTTSTLIHLWILPLMALTSGGRRRLRSTRICLRKRLLSCERIGKLALWARLMSDKPIDLTSGQVAISARISLHGATHITKLDAPTNETRSLWAVSYTHLDVYKRQEVSPNLPLCLYCVTPQS